MKLKRLNENPGRVIQPVRGVQAAALQRDRFQKTRLKRWVPAHVHSSRLCRAAEAMTVNVVGLGIRRLRRVGHLGCSISGDLSAIVGLTVERAELIREHKHEKKNR